MQVQDVINAVSTDIRQVLSNTAPDANILISWVDRVHKECLHGSRYSYLLKALETVSTTAGTSLYTLGTSPRVIEQVYDRTFDRELIDMDAKPGPGDPVVPDTAIQWPKYYKRSGATNFYIFPAPQKAALQATLEVHYQTFATDLANLTDTLQIPNDGISLVVAGVNMYATNYLRLFDEAAKWQQIYQELKGN